MAPSSNYTLIALLVALAGLILQPSAASRIGGGLAIAIAENADRASSPASPENGLPPQPRECRPWLARMMPCAGFLTNSTVYAPEATCCDGFNAMFTLDTVTCLCHVANGDIGQLLPAPKLHMRMVELFSLCGHDGAVDLLAEACKLKYAWIEMNCGWSAADRPCESLTLAIAIAIAIASSISPSGKMAMIN